MKHLPHVVFQNCHARLLGNPQCMNTSILSNTLRRPCVSTVRATTWPLSTGQERGRTEVFGVLYEGADNGRLQPEALLRVGVHLVAAVPGVQEVGRQDHRQVTAVHLVLRTPGEFKQEGGT